MTLTRSPWGQKKRAQYIAEKKFQKMVEDLAWLTGWRPFHLNPSDKKAAGFPDLVLFRERVIFAELKSRSPNTGRAGHLAPKQTEMAHYCFKAGAEYYSWLFPDDWDALEAVLNTPAKTGRVVL